MQPKNISKEPRANIIQKDFSKKRDCVEYNNFSSTFVTPNAHNSQIKCIKALPKGLFLTTSTDKTLKIWNPLNLKPVVTMKEELAIQNVAVISTFASECLIVYLQG